jgi:peptidyl-prolyl cis-trans isomerase B (cyclophilin B)
MPSRRRPRPTSSPAPEPAPLQTRPLWAGVIALVVVVLVAGAGIAITISQRPDLTGPFARCSAAAQLAPGLYTAAPQMCINTKKNYTVDIETTKGLFTVQLLAGQSPKTVNNFVVLALNGYFNGLRFFDTRDWEVRTGDPTDSGKGGPGYTLPPEPIAKNESWPTGSLAMARMPDGSLSGGQFFITRTAWPTGNPTVSFNHFATVTQGFDIVSQLSGSDRILRMTVRQA